MRKKYRKLTHEIRHTLKSMKNKSYQNKLIKTLVDNNFDYKEIAKELGRTKESVYQLWYSSRKVA